MTRYKLLTLFLTAIVFSISCEDTTMTKTVSNEYLSQSYNQEKKSIMQTMNNETNIWTKIISNRYSK